MRDAAEIRHAATAEGILCLTAIETAVAAAEALDPSIAAQLSEVHSLAEWVPNPGVPPERATAPASPSRPARRSGPESLFDLVVFDCNGVLVDSERLFDPPRRGAARGAGVGR